MPRFVVRATTADGLMLWLAQGICDAGLVRAWNDRRGFAHEFGDAAAADRAGQEAARVYCAVGGPLNVEVIRVRE